MDEKEIKANLERIDTEIADLLSQLSDINQEINGLTFERDRVEASIIRLHREKELLEELQDLDSGDNIRWRANVGEYYYSFYMHEEDGGVRVCLMEETGSRIDDINWKKGYYFRTREEAEEWLENSKKHTRHENIR